MKRVAALATLAALAVGLGAAACVPPPRVVRVYDGRIVEGRYVSPEAYAAFLRGVLAEEAGDIKAAVGAYAKAVDEDEDDPAIWTRIAAARCKNDPKDAEADRAFARATKLDPTYAGTLAARARCATARGRTDEAASLARAAAAQDPKNVGLEALAVRSESSKSDPAARERAIALTEEHGAYAAAWDALIMWGTARRDVELVARGFEGLVHAAPARGGEVEQGAVALLEGGHLALARRVASALTDAPRELGVVGPRDATVARLAVDEALARGDRDRALARATRGHVPLAELAARAYVLEKKDLAAELAKRVADADPSASGAQMVKAALKSTPPAASAAAKGQAQAPDPFARVTDQPPELCALVLADRMATASGVEAARVWLARIVRTPMPKGDPLAGPLAVDLASRGVLPAAELPAELRSAAQRARATE